MSRYTGRVSARAARRAERRKQKQKPRARSFPWFTALVVGVVVVFGFVLLRSLGAFDVTTTTGALIDPKQATLNAGQQVPIMGNNHLNPDQSFTAYNSTPPTSGPHWNAAGRGPIAWGVYTTTQRDEGVTHNLEHGGVLIAYNGISDEDLAKLRSIRGRYPKDKFSEVKIILEPYARIEQGTIALAAWGWLDKMTGVDEKRVVGFLAAHIGQGPEDAP